MQRMFVGFAQSLEGRWIIFLIDLFDSARVGFADFLGTSIWR